MSCLYALVQYKHTAMSLRNEFYLYFTLDPQILNFFWVQISRASLSASWNQRALTTATCSGFNSVSFPMTFCSIFLSLYLTLTLSRYCSLFSCLHFCTFYFIFCLCVSLYPRLLSLCFCLFSKLHLLLSKYFFTLFSGFAYHLR